MPASIKKILIYFILFIIAVWSVNRLWMRFNFEQKNNMVEICVEFNQIERICNKENCKPNKFFKQLRKTGVTSIVLEEETVSSLEKFGKLTYLSTPEVNKLKVLNLLPLQSGISPESIIVYEGNLASHLISVIEEKTGHIIKPIRLSKYTLLNVKDIPQINNMYLGFLPEKMNLIKQHGFKTVFKLNERAWIPKELPKIFSCFLIDRYLNIEAGEELILCNKRVALVEFRPVGQSLQKNLGKISGNVLRGHRVGRSKKNKFLIQHKIDVILSRWVRAVKERNCRILYFDFLDSFSLEENLNYLELLCKRLKKSGFVFDMPLRISRKMFVSLSTTLSRVAAFLVAVGIPIFSLSYVLKKNVTKNFIAKFLLVCILNLAGGLLISSILADYVFLVKLDEFRGVKLSLILPFVLAVPLVYSFEEIKVFLNNNVKIKTVILSVILFAVIVFMFVRTGNYMQITGLETQFRFSLEKIFGVRPRFKEFLIGHPIMLFGLWSNIRILILVGLIGQISIINSFIHAHTPLAVTFMRTFYGYCIGLAIGILLIFFLSLTGKICTKRCRLKGGIS